MDKVREILTQYGEKIHEIRSTELHLANIFQKKGITREEAIKLYNTTNTSFPFFKYYNAFLISQQDITITPKTWGIALQNLKLPSPEEDIYEQYWDSFLMWFEKANGQNEEIYQFMMEKMKNNTKDKKTMIILHTADWHFDNDPDNLNLTTKSIDYIHDYAKSEKPDLIIIAGDSTHSRLEHDSPGLIALVDAYSKLSEIAPILAITGTKSHDGLNLDILNKVITNNKMLVISKPTIVVYRKGEMLTIDESCPLKMDDLILFAIPPTGKVKMESSQSPLNRFTELAAKYKQDGQKTILISHGTVNEAILSSGMLVKDYEFQKEMLESSFDLILLGHIHKAQKIGEKIFYAGSIIRRDKGEVEEKGFYIHELHKGESRFIRIPTRQIISLEFDRFPNLEEITDIPQGADVRISYKVKENELHKINDEALKEHILTLGAQKVRISRVIVPQHKIRAHGISKIQSLPEKVLIVAKNLNITLSDSIIEKCEEIVSIDPETVITNYEKKI